MTTDTNYTLKKNSRQKYVLRIALCSLDQYWEDKTENFKQCSQAVREASSQSADLIIFPEMTLTGFSMNAQGIAEDYRNSESIGRFRRISKENRINIIFGLVLFGNKKPQNSLVLMNKSGRIAARYSKLHSFSYAGENQYYEQGNDVVFTSISGNTMGLTICYDLRFPELYAILSKKCVCIINIANWPLARIDHWNTLLKARAIENQIYVIGVNRTGIDGNKIRYRRSSMIISPRGEIISPESTEGNTDIYSIDFDYLKSYRKNFPVIKDRRISLYKRHI